MVSERVKLANRLTQRGDFGAKQIIEQTMIGAIRVLPNINHHARLSSIPPNATEIISPSAIPNAVHACCCMTKAPRIGAGEHSVM